VIVQHGLNGDRFDHPLGADTFANWAGHGRHRVDHLCARARPTNIVDASRVPLDKAPVRRPRRFVDIPTLDDFFGGSAASRRARSHAPIGPRHRSAVDVVRNPALDLGPCSWPSRRQAHPPEIAYLGNSSAVMARCSGHRFRT